MLMMLGAAKPVFRLPYTFVPRQECLTSELQSSRHVLRDRRTQGVELLTSIGLECLAEKVFCDVAMSHPEASEYLLARLRNCPAFGELKALEDLPAQVLIATPS